MPVFIWGNGACSNQGLSNQALLQQIASYGFLAISEGGPQGGGAVNSQTMKAAKECLSLPVHPSLQQPDLERIVEAVNALAKAGA